MAILLETCRISPPPEAETELTLPLTFLDIGWMNFIPIRRLLFYKFPCSKADFLDKALPHLKNSLSLTLKHYRPLAGNLLYPLNTDDDENKPFIRYVPSDSISLTILESTKNFDYLTAYHARDADEFYDFVPKLPPVKDGYEYKIVPVSALQVTLFPNRGICIGFSNSHVLGDASSIVGFLKAWASFSRFGGDEELVQAEGRSFPDFDRSHIEDRHGLDMIFWNHMKKSTLKPETFTLPTERIRATFILEQADINKLKEIVLTRSPFLGYISSFAVATAYAWSCFVKSGERIERDEYFRFNMDARGRASPSIPANYFGNCLAYTVAKVGHKELVGEEGFVVAATAIAEGIKNRVNAKDGVLKGMSNWMTDKAKFKEVSVMGVSGSPKFDLYGVNFGWGRAKKVEAVSIDGEKYSMSLCKYGGDSPGGLEFGFSLPKERMERFAAIFVQAAGL